MLNLLGQLRLNEADLIDNSSRTETLNPTLYSQGLVLRFGNKVLEQFACTIYISGCDLVSS